jgi:hypothetical protein
MLNHNAQLNWTREDHSALMKRVGRGEPVGIITYSGETVRVAGTTRWDEGFAASANGRSFRYSAGIYGVVNL